MTASPHETSASVLAELINEFIESERRSAPSLPGPPPPPADLLCQPGRENCGRLTHNSEAPSQPRLVARGTAHQVSSSAWRTCRTVVTVRHSAVGYVSWRKKIKIKCLLAGLRPGAFISDDTFVFVLDRTEVFTKYFEFLSVSYETSAPNETPLWLAGRMMSRTCCIVIMVLSEDPCGRWTVA